MTECCCEISPPEFAGNPDRECPMHGETPDPLAAIRALADGWTEGGAASNPFPDRVVLDVDTEVLEPLRAALATAEEHVAAQQAFADKARAERDKYKRQLGREEEQVVALVAEVERLRGVTHECNRQIDQIVSERNDAEETVRAHESMRWPEEAHRLQQRLYEAKRQLSREEYRSDRLRDRLHEAEDRAARYEIAWQNARKRARGQAADRDLAWKVVAVLEQDRDEARHNGAEAWEQARLNGVALNEERAEAARLRDERDELDRAETRARVHYEAYISWRSLAIKTESARRALEDEQR